MIPPIITKTLTLAVIPKLVEEAFNWLFGSDTKEPEPPKKKPRKKVLNRKKVDTTQLTKQHYDFIIYAHKKYLEYNTKEDGKDDGKRITQVGLTKAINETFGTNKSKTSFSNIWLGHVKREDLPDGDRDFTKEMV